jgi:hypothetical protein
MPETITRHEHTSPHDRAASRSRGRDDTPSHGVRSYAAVAVAVLASVLGLLFVPWLGALSALALFVAVVPLGARASTRLVASLVLCFGTLGAALAVGETWGVRVLSTDRVRLMFLGLVVLAAAFVLLGVARRTGLSLARPDLGLVPLVAVPLLGWWATGHPASGVRLGQEVGGLMALGWDHQSHFSIFAALFEQGGVFRSGPPEDASMFLGYPPLAGGIGVALTTLVTSSPLDPTALLPLYVQSSGLLFGLAAGMLAWTGAAAGRRVFRDDGRPRQAGVAALFAGLATGLYVILGPTFAFFDYGFTNFLFAVAVAAAASFVAVVELDRHELVGACVAVAATAAMGLLWTPLVLLIVPAGVVIGVRIVRRRRWFTLGTTTVVAAAGAWVVAWQVFRIAPSGGAATSLAATLAGIGGGQPAAPLPHLTALTLVAAVGLTLAGFRKGAAWWAILLPALAGGLITLAFTYNTIRAGFRPAEAYYVAKALWTAYLALVPAVGAAVGWLVLATARAAAAPEGEPRPRGVTWRNRLSVVLTGTVAVVAVAFSAPTPNAPNGALDYYSLPIGYQAVIDRENVFRTVAQGDVVANGEAAADNRPRRLAIVWDSGDLLTNRWVAALRNDNTGAADAVYTALGGAPYLEPARDALIGQLNANQQLDVVVLYSTKESRALLRPVVRQFPDRVALKRM